MSYDVTIIGAGIIGLATAYTLSIDAPGLKIAVLEKENSIATHQTGHNSGVIHSGIYYKPGSAKAMNCKSGYNLLLEFCKKEHIYHEICGKIIVATNASEEKKLQDIYDRGILNGLKGLKILNQEELKEKEPHVYGTKGIFVPQAGIVDYKQISKKLFEISKKNGVAFFFDNKVVSIKKRKESYLLNTNGKNISTKFLVNCAGLYSDKIAKMDGINLNAKIIPFRGEYYLLKKEKAKLVNNLIYPVPDPNFPFLGVHFTRRINGKIDAGPNAVLAFKREGYTKSDIDLMEFLESISYLGFVKVALKYWKVGAYEMYRSFSKKAFVKSLQKLIPEIQEKDLIVGEAGVRAQLCDIKGNLIDDFLIEKNDNAIHVVNSPSPAATSSLNIGKEISLMVLQKNFNEI